MYSQTGKVTYEMSKMSKQIANQANAQKSTGPVTPAGKARSARNSRTHGLCAKDIVIGPEEQADYDAMLEAYLLELDPDGPIEQTLFSEIVGTAWQLGRVQRMEAEACAGKRSYGDILDDDVLQKKLDRLARHHTRIERTFHRCLKQLKALQKERIDGEEIYVTLRRRDAISERTQFATRAAADADYNDLFTPRGLAEIDRDRDHIPAEVAAQRERKAA